MRQEEPSSVLQSRPALPSPPLPLSLALPTRRAAAASAAASADSKTNPLLPCTRRGRYANYCRRGSVVVLLATPAVLAANRLPGWPFPMQISWVFIWMRNIGPASCRGKEKLVRGGGAAPFSCSEVCFLSGASLNQRVALCERPLWASAKKEGNRWMKVKRARTRFSKKAVACYFIVCIKNSENIL